ncbi:hypothetical protein RND71_038304 [Anisodus tanguticus]|uniref:Uncharacterized protein n=1 Tax=Anisodus tanguticus TaxID=243964 RepID=A0AAE1US05_9SOLA|nr:hypothetical protein RND71_038304 [Anisodus tanguticus]
MGEFFLLLIHHNDLLYKGIKVKAQVNKNLEASKINMPRIITIVKKGKCKNVKSRINTAKRQNITIKIRIKNRYGQPEAKERQIGPCCELELRLSTMVASSNVFPPADCDVLIVYAISAFDVADNFNSTT